MKLSIVATLYQSAPYIEEFHRRAGAAASGLIGDDYEIVLVNDGSPDDSLARAIALTKRDPHVVVVDLSRNFGHHKAMMTGLAYADGQDVFLIDCDLEEEPEWLLDFVEALKVQDVDVVFGVQVQRKGGFFERWSGEWFYKIFSALAGFRLDKNIVTARLMSRRYVDALLRHQEREVFMAGLWHITGFSQYAATVRKHSNGVSTYTMRRKIALFVNSITSFSNLPLIGIFYIGVFIFFAAGLYSFYLVLQWVLFEKPLSGWTSVMASIWVLGGIVTSSIGIVGIYLSKVFSEVKGRPYTIVRNVHREKNRC